MHLIGVCTDVGESPNIVMAFMANGSLLAYFKRERSHLLKVKWLGLGYNIMIFKNSRLRIPEKISFDLLPDC